MHKYYIHMVTSQNFSRVFFLVGQTVFICVNMANITTQSFFFCLSVCLHAINTAENLHTPSTPVVTFHLNTLLSCILSSPLCFRSWRLFLGGQLVLICVSTGPLTLTKIDFFCLYAVSTGLDHLH